MHLGIKVGPDNWREKLLDSRLDVRHVEIYHNFAYADDYAPLFASLRERDMHGRLHASTPLPGGVYPTLATADQGIRSASADLTRRTLDVAAREGMSAVVVHPGSCLIPRIHKGRVEVIGEATSAEEGRRWATEEALRLAEYGRARGVEPLIENMPGREFAAYDPVDRTTGIDVRFVPYGLLRDLGEEGLCLCVDVAHLYTEMMVDGAGPPAAAQHNGLYHRVKTAAAELVPYARHLHLSTVTPPWNGTDGHGGFLETDYALGAIPTREQLLAVLRLFDGPSKESLSDRDRTSLAGHASALLAGQDTWIIPEPGGGAAAHLANYGRLREWLGGIV